MELNTKFEGTGSFAEFVENVVDFFKAINNASVEVPSGYSGAEPTLRLEDGKSGPQLVLDMAEALVFTLNNVQWELVGSAAFVDWKVSVQNGKLVVYVHADDPD
jgi:hypothetical protein